MVVKSLYRETMNTNVLCFILASVDRIDYTLWAQEVNWTYIRRSEDVLDVFLTSYVHSIYVLCPGGNQCYLFNQQVFCKTLCKHCVKIVTLGLTGFIYKQKPQPNNINAMSRAAKLSMKYQRTEAVAQRYSVKKSFLEIPQKFTGKRLYQSLFFNKIAGLRLWHRCFPVNFAKFLRTLFLIEHVQWLLLNGNNITM